nr:hypothetical protein CFP56_78415 [Quercus suber]
MLTSRSSKTLNSSQQANERTGSLFVPEVSSAQSEFSRGTGRWRPLCMHTRDTSGPSTRTCDGCFGCDCRLWIARASNALAGFQLESEARRNKQT